MFDQVIIFCAQYLYLVIAGIAFLFWAFSEKTVKRNLLGAGVPAFVIALGIDKILNQLIESPRPFLTEGVMPLFPHVASNGFPSEHVLFAITIAGTVFIYNKKLGILLAALALLVGFGRIFANVHHPVDIFGGLIIGIVSVAVGWLIFSRFLAKYFIQSMAHNKE